MKIKKWGKYLRMLRQKEGLSQSDLADLVGVLQTDISRYELGKRRPSNEAERKLLEVFDPLMASSAGLNKHKVVEIDKNKFRSKVYEAGLTLAEAGEISGLSGGTLKDWGKISNPTKQALEMVCHYCNLDKSEFVIDKQSNPRQSAKTTADVKKGFNCGSLEREVSIIRGEITRLEDELNNISLIDVIANLFKAKK